ncbi:hypothetical protein D1B31_04800 [Neobacillus notoginsengisoli]|uniref:Uncharacterized protein n=1 Tax=Neobacillus notoginsengisoli TaxID=1578198 RepID=A0A417YWV2_9BACI|nr:hypothetical protein [Neobacillus notoginsengisoli]RHW41968.1 hypothetical protein D1B31_04800 [Neobacillus notoginsengisoli]
MSKLSKAFNEYFYAWGDNDPNKKVLRYGKFVSLKQLHGYDDHVYYRPRRQMAGTVIILGGVGLFGASGYGLYKGVSYLKAKYDKRKTDKENL